MDPGPARVPTLVKLAELAVAVQAGDVAAVDLQAHSMKGGSANVGAVRLSAAARELELLAKESKP